MFVVRNCLGVIAALILALPAVATELVMVEQHGCEWCKRWNEEIAPAYPNTTEGRFAPLRRVDLRAMPEDLKLNRRVNFTPTFLIVEHGQEIARIEGYPGADFFWPVLTKMLTDYTDFNPAAGEEG